MMLLMMQTMMGEATIQQVAFSFNHLWSSPIGFHRLRLQSDNSTERSRSGTSINFLSVLFFTFFFKLWIW